jgi:hypothetical protein
MRRAAGVSPPWSVNRCGENRPPFDRCDHEQERRASARRGTGAKPTFPPSTFDDAFHGWLTPAAPGCATCVPCGMRHLRCTNAHPQERRASARRGTGKRVCNGDRLFRTQHVRPGTVGFHPTAGLHQPLLVGADAVATFSGSIAGLTHRSQNYPNRFSTLIVSKPRRFTPPVAGLLERIRRSNPAMSGRKNVANSRGCSNVFGEAIPPTRFTAPGEFGSRGVARTHAEKRAAGRWLVPVIPATVAKLSNGPQKPVRFTTALFLADRGPGGMIIVPDKCRLGLRSAKGGEFSL